MSTALRSGLGFWTSGLGLKVSGGLGRRQSRMHTTTSCIHVEGHPWRQEHGTGEVRASKVRGKRWKAWKRWEYYRKSWAATTLATHGKNKVAETIEALFVLGLSEYNRSAQECWGD